MRTSFQIGTSVLGQPLECYHFLPPDYARPRPGAVLFGAIHGDEPASAMVLARLIEELVERPPGRPTWIVPVLNPDGLAAGTKDNANGVDLNRHFAAANWQSEHPHGYFPGRAPETEPEVAALVQLLEQSGAKRLVAVHATFRCINWDGTGEALANEMSTLSGYPAKGDIGYPTPGSFGSKYGVDRSLEVVTIESPYLIAQEEAWTELRAALRHVVDLPSDAR